MKEYAAQYKNELINNVIPFWLKYSQDKQCGGYLCSLDRKGEAYDTDKYVWLQGREVWCFAMLYDKVEKRPEWLEMARQGAEFLRRYGKDSAGRYYFALTREGVPLVQPYNIFADCFASMAFGVLSRNLKGQGYEELAVEAYNGILARKDDPKGVWSKAYPGTRPMRGFALPMILCNLSLELEHILGGSKIDATARALADEIFVTFVDKDTGLVRENVGPQGEFIDSFEGRQLNPGHAIEATWFLMDIGERLGDKAMVRKAIDLMFRTLEFGWDEEFGGIYYFRDLHGHPTPQLEWDQKLWWVHVESLVALAKSYRLTRDPRCEAWFKKVHDYAWSHFRDPEYGEWFGYLNRRGEVLLPLKGGKWKGCFHVPRALYQVSSTLERTAD